MANINKIRLSGTTYNIEDANAAKTVELTQAQYDALVSGGTVDPNTFYIITDAQPTDISQYWTSAQTQSAITQAVSGKQDTLSAGTGIDITNNVISVTGGGGGGKAIEGGHGITVTTGATADTVSLNLPISAGTGTNSIKEGYGTTASGNSSHAEGSGTTASGSYSHAEGHSTIAKGNNGSHAEGSNTQANSSYSHAEGYFTKATNSSSHAEGEHTTANGSCSHAEGYFTGTNNEAEHASGRYNVSNKANNTFGDSGNTLFSVGNGTSENARHNAFEIRQNGDIYFNDGTNDVKLQDKFTEINNTIGDIETLLAAI